MKHFIMVLVLGIHGYARAQSITPATINSGGMRGVVNNIHFEFSLGEDFTTTIGGNGFITQGMLQPFGSAQGALPVTGLQFSGKRIDKHKVQLNWKTVQEMNNRGFYVERRKENENNFALLEFVSSKAPGGNSSQPLQYEAVDMNDFGGNTYYRLKQMDIDAQSAYSVVVRVSGEASRSLTLKAWPVPSRGDFTVVVEGIDKDVLQVLDITGRVVREVAVSNASQSRITGLRPGAYIIRLAAQKDVVQKMVVQ